VKLVKTGKAKSIGVPNSSVKFLEDLIPHLAIVPAVNQIKNHPYLPQQDIVDYCKSRNIHSTAYSTMGSAGSPVMKDEEIRRVGNKYVELVGTVLFSYRS
jgi:glycerol 2-dehydrogenase (NADP+)